MARALLLFCLVAAALWPRPAQAALTLCNRTSYILYAATSAIQMARKEPLTAETYLVHARSALAHSGPARAWGGNYPVCVKDANFTLRQAVTQPYCTAGDTFALSFAPLDNHGQRDWTMHFDEKPALTLSQAQLVGAKRLLKDNGYRIAAMDAKPDKATGAALNDFRKKARLGPDAGNRELFTALERAAARTAAPAGYTVCNETREMLLVALGEVPRGRSVSRGWWTVQAGACARAITTPLAANDIFLLAQRGNGQAVVAGPQKFCTTPSAFEIQGAGNCATRGYAESGFARTDTRGRSGYIARITPSGLAR